MIPTQAFLFPQISERSPELQSAIRLLADAGVEARGAIFTQPDVIEHILDLVHYTPDNDLPNIRLLEPSCGRGDFLLPAISRLITSYISKYKSFNNCEEVLSNSIRAVELNQENYSITCQRVFDQLLSLDIPTHKAHILVKAWMVQDDFLLTELTNRFDVVVGNPPYVRQERIPTILLDHYRAKYSTIYDRADLYIPFFERGLSLLASGGKLAFICSDRWLTNTYGGPLRKFITQGFHLEYYARMHNMKPFHKDVAAYPAIVVIGEGKSELSQGVKVKRSDIDQPQQSSQIQRQNAEHKQYGYSQHVIDTHPWVLNLHVDERQLLERLEREFPFLEHAGCKVGIGVATGCDAVYIQDFDTLPVEDDCKLPLVMAPDIRTGSLQWSGKGIINPFTPTGKVVSLHEYPLLAKYLTEHDEQIRKRHVAQKNPNSWFRTIDRIYPQLTTQPKLLIPDITLESIVVYDEGNYYPHHNLYYITSTSWELLPLQALLRSDIARFFISAYSTRMRGGYLRFQAQYLRRIHIPAWYEVSNILQAKLLEAAHTGTIDAINTIAFDLYDLSTDERGIVKSLKQRERNGNQFSKL